MSASSDTHVTHTETETLRESTAKASTRRKQGQKEPCKQDAKERIASMKTRRKKAGYTAPIFKLPYPFSTRNTANHVTIKPKHPKAYLRSSVMRQKKRI